MGVTGRLGREEVAVQGGELQLGRLRWGGTPVTRDLIGSLESVVAIVHGAGGAEAGKKSLRSLPL